MSLKFDCVDDKEFCSTLASVFPGLASITLKRSAFDSVSWQAVEGSNGKWLVARLGIIVITRNRCNRGRSSSASH